MYISLVTTILAPSFVVLACIDRWMLSSINVNLRLWSQPRIAYRSIIGVSTFWILFSIHAFFGSMIYSGPGYSYCYIARGSYQLFVALLTTIFTYLLPPTLMIIFGSLTIINVRQTKRRIRPTTEGGIMQRKDRYLLRMLLLQVLVSVIFTIPLIVYQVTSFIRSLLRQIWVFDCCIGVRSSDSQLAKGFCLANVERVFSGFKSNDILYSVLYKLLYLYPNGEYIPTRTQTTC